MRILRRLVRSIAFYPVSTVWLGGALAIEGVYLDIFGPGVAVLVLGFVAVVAIYLSQRYESYVLLQFRARIDQLVEVLKGAHIDVPPPPSRRRRNPDEF